MIKLASGRSIAVDQFGLLTPATRGHLPVFENVGDYDQYLIDSLPQVYQEGFFYYHLPSTLILYESSDHLNHNKKTHPPLEHMIMTFHQNDRRSSYATRRMVSLVGLQIPSNQQKLINLAETDQQKLAIRSGQIHETLDYLCQLGFDGFLSPPPYRIYLCRAKRLVKPISVTMNQKISS